MERWLVISNCMTAGLANCFKFLNSSFDADAVDIWQYRQDPEGYNKKFSEYFRVVVHPEIFASLSETDRQAAHMSIIPGVYFDAFHPDACTAIANGKVISGSMGEYHSVIALAAFAGGLDENETKRLYRREIYAVGGYFDGWTAQRDAFLKTFADFGLDMRESFIRWSRASRPFMYSMNHPTIDVIHDIARVFMARHGVETHDTYVRPPDNLVAGPCYPIYTEIGEALGFEGSYLFKPMNEYRYRNLDQFLKSSFEQYRKCESPIVIPPPFTGRYERICRAIEGLA